MQSDYSPPELSFNDLDTLHEQLIDMQRTVVVCTICIVAAFLVILPPLIYLYIRKTERGVWLLNEKSDNLLEYYKTIADDKKEKSLV